jgi:hypothetical protein
MKLEFSETLDFGPRVAVPQPGDAAPHVPPKAPLAASPLSFDLPRSLLRQIVLVALGYLAVMGFAFRQGTGIGLIFAIFTLVAVAYYGLPLVMARASGAKPDAFPPRGAWGIDTASGYLPGRAAYAQIMTVPILMLAWAVVVAFIR